MSDNEWAAYTREDEEDEEWRFYNTPLWVTTKAGKVTIGWRQIDTGDWSDMLSVPYEGAEDEWDHGYLGPYGVIAYKPITQPAPYQEATR